MVHCWAASLRQWLEENQNLESGACVEPEKLVEVDEVQEEPHPFCEGASEGELERVVASASAWQWQSPW